MLNELKSTNEKLRDNLRNLRQESCRLYEETRYYLDATREMDSPVGPPLASSSRRQNSFHGSVVSSASSRRNMLSDRAKNIRGEASKRIDGLLQDWREYKERADDELRRRLRSETVLREKLARKERETEEFAKEVTSLRTLLIDQKKTIEQLRMDLDAEAKCRARCADLELQISQLNRYITEVHGELRARDDILKGNEAEREALLQMNAELREVNSDQKSKLEACERDVTATQMELEILEEIVQALNDRKSTVFNSRANSPAPQSSATPDLMHLRYNTAPKSPGANKGILSSTPPPYRSKAETLPFETSIIAEASKPAATGIISKLAVGSKQSSSDMNGNTDESRKLTDRQSAMSALKSLQKEHSDKCSFLAQHIQKLKEENKAKEDTISRLQTKTQKVSP